MPRHSGPTATLRSFDIGPSCFLPQRAAADAILVALPPSPLLAGLTQVFGALDLVFLAALAPSADILGHASLLVTDEDRFDSLGAVPEHLRVVVFTADASRQSSAATRFVHPATSTADLLELIAGWTDVEHAALSSREREILALVSQGLSNEEIAATCYVSTATVKTHLLRSFRKLGVSDRAAAVYKAVKMGLIV